MHAAEVTSKCFECGDTMRGHVENYRYTESGLNSVVLSNVLVFRCKRCGATMPQIVAAAELHRKIAMALLEKETRLTGAEVRFLRKAVGYSATELAKLAGTSKSVVSRWENRSLFSQENDRLIRMICVHKMLRDAFANQDVTEALAGTAQRLLSGMDDTLRKLRKTRGRRQQYVIDPAELRNYGSAEPRVKSSAVQ